MVDRFPSLRSSPYHVHSGRPYDREHVELQLTDSHSSFGDGERVWEPNTNDERFVDNVSLLSYHDEAVNKITKRAAVSVFSEAAEQGQRPSSGSHSYIRSTFTRIQGFAKSQSTVLRDHNPFTAKGRVLLESFILRSGPAYHSPIDTSARTEKKGAFSGWRMGALFNLILLSLCLAFETSMLIVAIVMDRNGPNTSLDGVLYSGSCAQTSKLTVYMALAVNMIATFTLGSSNYIMQCLNAPTGWQLSKAHADRGYSRVGISSPLNFRYLSWTNLVMWWTMAVTSVPVHLLFNSAFYGTLQANDYAITIFAADFETADLWSDCSQSVNGSWFDFTCTLQQEAASFERLEPSACIRRYSAPLINKFSNVILVSSTKSDERNATLESLWSEKVDLLHSNLNFTSQRSAPSSGMERTNGTGGDDTILGSNAVLGIFTAYEYGGWVNDLHESMNWHLDISTLNQTIKITKITHVENGNTYLWTAQDIVAGFSNGSITAELNNNFTIELNDEAETRLLANVSMADGTLIGWAPRRAMAGFDPSAWLCQDNTTSICTEQLALDGLNRYNGWRVSPHGVQIDYCLSQGDAIQKCEVRYSSIILGVVIGCDLIKVILIYFVLHVSDKLLVTTGDALVHFMENPEPLTKSKCLLTQDEADKVVVAELKEAKTTARAAIPAPHWRFVRDDNDNLKMDYIVEPPKHLIDSAGRKKKHEANRRAFDEVFYNAPPALWRTRKLRWGHAVSRLAWLYLSTVILCAMIITAVLFANGYHVVKPSGAGIIWNRGLLGPDPNAVFTGTSKSGAVPTVAFIWQVVIINSPQLFFSMIYFAYNGAFTMMHAAEEWSGFATERKSLRVSEPRPGQRSSYWLNLPWSYSLPLVAVSSVLHWMVSRSLYLVNIDVYSPDGTPDASQTIFACGFSTVFLLMVLGTLVFMTAVIFGFSFKPLNAEIPFIGFNSLAISAACHGSKTHDEVCKPLLWGVTELPEDGLPGHCALSSGEVSKPVPGQSYS